MSILETFSKKQIQSFKESVAKINIWEGSVRSGKTFISLLRFVDYVKKCDEGSFVVISRTYDSFKKNLLDLLCDFAQGNSKHYQGKRELHMFGKVIHVVGADDERAEAKIRGSTFQGAYVDEITIIPRSVWMMLISRCAMHEAKIFGTTNPDSPFHWLKTDFLSDNPDVRSWRFRLEDNPKIQEKEKEYLTRQYKGLWYQRFIEGLWVQAEGSIYDTFDSKLHVIDFPPSPAQYYIIGVDYGTSNPCAFVSIGINTNRFPNIWVEEEYYYDSKVHQRQKTDTEYAEDLTNFIKNKPVKAIYIDPSAASFRLELQKQGVQNLYDAENEVIDGIRFVSKLLNNGTLKFASCCKNLIQETQSYVWDAKSASKGEDKPLKAHDHALDAMRYALYTHLFNKDLRSMSAIELDNSWQEAINGGPVLPAFFRDDFQRY